MNRETQPHDRREEGEPRPYDGSEIAIIGMACRLPGANDVERFWRNLCEGVESLTRLSDDELVAAGVDLALARSPSYVRNAPVLDQVELFDAAFFGYTPLEAKLMDPQHRLFLECSWEAFERAGYDPERYGAPVGVFTGAKTNTYLFSLFSDRELFRSVDTFQIALGNDLAAMATRVSYKLNLRGPSYALHTACSTSLVAVHLACQSLLLGECRMALAGGAAVNAPHRRGYSYQKGGILSPDGSCRTFDAAAAGSNFGNGVGAVLLKRLEDALADGDHVHALIRGSATNNDGAAKASYTAPGVEGQTAVLLEAMACAGVDAASLSYIEAHGTATELGDAIEMLALGNAFRAAGWRGDGGRARCAIGSVKTNLGHLETAAGVAGLIKTALALEHRQIPPSLHFERPSPKIDFASSPFYVNTELAEWPAGDGPRRAGVSSFGIGSTNAHVILEEPPAVAPPAPSRPWQLLALSARTATALDSASANLAGHLAAHPELQGPRLADVAYTLTVGRKEFQHRRILVCRDGADAASALAALDPARVLTHPRDAAGRSVAFLFPGLGEHAVGMARGLYAGGGEPVFRAELDRCAELLGPLLGIDLREVLYPTGTDTGAGEPAPAPGLDLRRMLRDDRGDRAAGAAGARLDETRLAQPALFAVEYALARLWMSWGIRPRAMIGYSLGEYVAACLAGVMSLADAVRLVAERARMIQELPGGAMLAVPLAEAELAPLLAEHGLSLAAVNGPAGCVAAGSVAGIAALEGRLGEIGTVCRRLPTTHPFHAAELAPLAPRLVELARSVALAPPQIPYLSNVTGTWITAEQATDPGYWALHMCQPVRFGDAAAELLAAGGRVLLEVGPGQGLGSFVRQQPACDDATAQATFASLPNAYSPQTDLEWMLTTLGKLWLIGQEVDWSAYWSAERRRREPLPTYPFERQRYWVDPPRGDAEQPPAAATVAGRRVTLDKQADPGDWLYRPVWKESASVGSGPPRPIDGPWLVLSDGDQGLGAAVVDRLRQAGCSVLAATATAVGGEDVALPPPHAASAGVAGGAWAIDPAVPAHYGALLAALPAAEPLNVLHLWTVAPAPAAGTGFERAQDLGFYSLIFLAQAIGKRGAGAPVRISVVSSRLQRVTDRDQPEPDKATLLGPCRVIPQELARVSCRSVDVEPSHLEPSGLAGLAERLLAEAAAPAGTGSEMPVVAYRGADRWVQDFARVAPPAAGDEDGGESAAAALPRLREAGVYLVTGGLGGIGMVLAEHLARTLRAKLVLTGRSPLPPAEEWEGWLASHPPSDRTSVRLRQLRQLEALGAEVMAVAADAADEGRMREVVAAARQRFGAIHGVLHLAGTPGGGIIQLKTRAAAARIMAPKVQGARVLEALFPEPGELDFLLLFSSIAAVLGEFGQADYCGANSYLDSVAQRNAARGYPLTVTVDSDIWRDVGLAVHTEVPAHLRPWREEMLAQALSPDEGTEAFARALRCGVPQVVISAQPLAGRIELGRSFTGESFLAELEKSRPASRRVLGTGFAGAGNGRERRIAEIWQRLLGIEQLGVHDNFFDLGGNSLVGLQVVSEIQRELGVQVAPVTLFESPTVAALARHIAGLEGETAEGATEPTGEARWAGELAARRERLVRRRPLEREAAPEDGQDGGRDIAIVSMTGRFPGAASVERLWDNLRAGVEAVRFFTDEELLAAGVEPALVADPRYVKAGAILDGIDLFDAGLFGFSPREAEVTDPQHRIFLECAWEVLERAGYDPATYPGAIGVFAGANLSTYLMRLYADPAVRGSVNMLQAILGNDKDSLTTTVSYKLNLRGPSVAVQTFCSTSLVAVHMACRSLRGGECDMALAGGVRVVVPDHQGYLYEHGGLAPSDGHSRSFDAKANGSVLGHGVGIVCLKRLADALADCDPVLAVIKGSAINNDGSLKAGYTAPSVNGQADAIAAAFVDAGVEPDSVSYVEAHGSATALGDPIEVAALTKAFRRFTDRVGYCPIGSVKSNFGHLDRAAGVTGLIKTVLALQHGEIPPSLLFDEPNPKIDFAHSPFFVNTAPRAWPASSAWPAGSAPRRAAVNSLGMGGTNVHLVLEEAPPAAPGTPSRDWQLLVLSAKTPTALETATGELRRHLETAPKPAEAPEVFADAAYTLKVGRHALGYRRALVCRDAAEAAAALADPRRALSAYCEEGERSLVFAFAGLGGHHVGMGRGLYAAEPAFRAAVDRCAELLEPLLGLDVRQVLYPPEEDSHAGAEDAGGPPAVDLRRMLQRAPAEPAGRLDETAIAQPALFVVEYALTRLLSAWGIRPQAVVGYSLGEYAAACAAGVLSLPDALALVAGRARLIADLPAGAMLAVGLPAEELAPLLDGELSLAAINGPEQSVAAGSPEAVSALEARLAGRGVACRRLRTSHAFHSGQMNALFARCVELAAGVELQPPAIPCLSNVTGTWLTAAEATDPTYWARHMCQPVRFSDAVAELRREPGRIVVEIGPGQSLGSLILQHPASREAEAGAVLAVLRHAYETTADQAYALTALAKLWLLGVKPDWAGFYAHERRRRRVLPTYPFERQRYWIDTAVERPAGGAPIAAVAGVGTGEAAATARLYLPSWKRLPLAASPRAAAPAAPAEPDGLWLLLAEDGSLGDRLAARLERAGRRVVRVTRQAAGGLAALLADLDRAPSHVVHLWSATPREGDGEGETPAAEYAAILSVGRALADRRSAAGAAGEPLRLWTVTAQAHAIAGEGAPDPAAAMLAAAGRTIASRLSPNVCRAVDVEVAAAGTAADERLLGQLSAELAGGAGEPLVALRGAHRWVATVEELADAPDVREPALRPGGVHLLAGGLGPVGFRFAAFLARQAHARLALVEPPGFPERAEWEAWLDGGGTIAERIRRILRLEELGAEVRVESVEPSDGAGMRRLAERLVQQWGPLAGLVHVAEAEDGDGLAVAAGASALRALDGIRRRHAPDLAWAVAPADGTALRLFAEALAEAPDEANDSGKSSAAGWTSIGWGLPVQADDASPIAEDPVLRRLLAAGPNAQLLVSSMPLPAGWSRLDDLPLPAAPSAPAGAKERAGGIGFYPRPGLRVDYAPPRDDLETFIGRLWEELLGVAQVGIHDNFLDLGGDSLLATRLVARMRDAVQLDLPVKLFFERSTVAELALAVREIQRQQASSETRELLDTIQGLSEEEMEAEIRRLETLVASEELANG